jgi:hypothetical protein
VRRACSASDHWQFSGKRIEPIRRGQPWRSGSTRADSKGATLEERFTECFVVEETSLDEFLGSKFWGQLRDGSSRGEFDEAESAGRTHELIRRGQPWRSGSTRADSKGATLEERFTECFVVEETSLDESFGSKFWGQLRDGGSRGEFDEAEFAERTHRTGPPGATLETLFNRFSDSLRRARGSPLSRPDITNRYPSQQLLWCSRTDRRGQPRRFVQWLTVWLRPGQRPPCSLWRGNVVIARRLRPEGATRRKGFSDVQKCSAFSTLREQSRSEEFAEEQPSTSVRLRSARPAHSRIALACLGGLDEADLRFGHRPLDVTGSSDVALDLKPSGRWEFVVSLLGLPSSDSASNR